MVKAFLIPYIDLPNNYRLVPNKKFLQFLLSEYDFPFSFKSN